MTGLVHTLAEPFQFGFMTNALIMSVLLAIPAALLSCFMVLKGWALMGDAMSHCVFPGVVFAYIVGMPFALGALFAAIMYVLISEYITDNSRVKNDTVMGIMFSGMLGLGLVMIVWINPDVNLYHILFGDLLGISMRQMVVAGVVAALVIVVVACKWRDFLLYAFDPIQAKTIGLKVDALHYGLLILIALTCVSILESVGALLGLSLLIMPGAVSFLLIRRFSSMMFISLIVVTISSLMGCYLAFFIDSALAPTIVIFLSIFFFISFFYSVRTAKR